MTPDEAYRVLGLEPGCSERELTRRFHLLAQQAHPDVGGSDRAFSRLSHAFAIVSYERSDRQRRIEVTTHVRSLRGRLRRLGRQLQRREHRRKIVHRTIRPTGGPL